MARRSPKSTIPVKLGDVDSAWLTDVMRDAGAISHTSAVTAHTVEPFGTGIGFAGTTMRMRLTYEPPEAGPATAVVKLPSEDPAIKGIFDSQEVYGREIAFYRTMPDEMPFRVPAHLGSRMDSPPPDWIGRALNVAADRAPVKLHIKATENVTALLKPSKRRYALLVEEVGGTCYNMAGPPSIELLSNVVDQLAQLHATFWGRTDLARTNHKRPLLSGSPRMFANTYRPVSRPIAVERWDWLEGDKLARLDYALDNFLVDHEFLNRPVTLVHGDPRIDNVIFPDTEPPIFIDWAMTAMAHPAFDVAYLMSSALDGPDARPIFDDMLDRYRTSLAANGRDIPAHKLADAAQACLRGIVSQMMAALPVLQGGYGEEGLADCWVPRLVNLIDPVS